jgi:hypothetical protein
MPPITPDSVLSKLRLRWDVVDEGRDRDNLPGGGDAPALSGLGIAIAVGKRNGCKVLPDAIDPRRQRRPAPAPLAPRKTLSSEA